ncbi:30S ribosomal protein S3 [Patescibacteria group bacterium]
MGRKVNPIGFRLGYWQTWKSRWFARKPAQYRENLLEDLKIRKFLMNRLKLAGIVEVRIERFINKMTVTLFVSRPGVVIGRGGTNLELLKKDLFGLVSLSEPEKNLKIDVVEVKNPELSAQLVAVRIAEQLERRFPHRRVISKTLERVMMSGAIGVKIFLSGRIAGAEISRTEKYSQGKVPLQTLRAKIDYAQIPALTKFGYIGVKVWIYKGEE